MMQIISLLNCIKAIKLLIPTSTQLNITESKPSDIYNKPSIDSKRKSTPIVSIITTYSKNKAHKFTAKPTKNPNSVLPIIKQRTRTGITKKTKKTHNVRKTCFWIDEPLHKQAMESKLGFIEALTFKVKKESGIQLYPK